MVSRHIEDRIQPAWAGGFELRCDAGSPLGAPPAIWAAIRKQSGLERRLSSRETATVWAVSRKSEFGRLVKEMNFLFAHQSSSPITPAMQSVSPMGRNAPYRHGRAR